MDATIGARARQLEEVKRSCGPLVRAYAVMQQSLEKMLTRDEMQKKVMTALELRLRQKRLDADRLRVVVSRRHEQSRLQTVQEIMKQTQSRASARGEKACESGEHVGEGKESQKQGNVGAPTKNLMLILSNEPASDPVGGGREA